MLGFLPWLLLAASTAISAQRVDGQFWPCNPTKNATGACAPNTGYPKSTYFIDFTKTTVLPPELTLSNYASIKFGTNGLEFTIKNYTDSPQVWTNFYMLGCKYEIEAQMAPGKGVMSTSVLISDDFDEIDFEMSGNNFNFDHGVGSNNYFGKGITGNWDRGAWFDITNPTTSFHKYSVDWNKDRTIWGLDGNTIRTFLASSGDKNQYQYPQSPMKLQLGIWDAGTPSGDPGTVNWAGGSTDLSEGPFTFYVKSLTITNYNPAYGYNWTDQSGSWDSIHLVQDPAAMGIKPTSTTPTPTPTPTPTSTTTTSKAATTSTSPSPVVIASTSTSPISSSTVSPSSPVAPVPTTSTTPTPVVYVSTSTSLIANSTVNSSSSVAPIPTTSTTPSPVVYVSTSPSSSIVSTPAATTSSVIPSSSSTNPAVSTSIDIVKVAYAALTSSGASTTSTSTALSSTSTPPVATTSSTPPALPTMPPMLQKPTVTTTSSSLNKAAVVSSAYAALTSSTQATAAATSALSTTTSSSISASTVTQTSSVVVAATPVAVNGYNIVASFPSSLSPSSTATTSPYGGPIAVGSLASSTTSISTATTKVTSTSTVTSHSTLYVQAKVADSTTSSTTSTSPYGGPAAVGSLNTSSTSSTSSIFSTVTTTNTTSSSSSSASTTSAAYALPSALTTSTKTTSAPSTMSASASATATSLPTTASRKQAIRNLYNYVIQVIRNYMGLSRHLSTKQRQQLGGEIKQHFDEMEKKIGVDDFGEAVKEMQAPDKQKRGHARRKAHKREF